jgi:hypothetical protein
MQPLYNKADELSREAIAADTSTVGLHYFKRCKEGRGDTY